MCSSFMTSSSVLGHVDDAGRAHVGGELEAVVVDVGDDDVARADVRQMPAAMMPIGPAPVISTSSPTQVE